LPAAAGSGRAAGAALPAVTSGSTLATDTAARGAGAPGTTLAARPTDTANTAVTGRTGRADG